MDSMSLAKRCKMSITRTYLCLQSSIAHAKKDSQRLILAGQAQGVETHTIARTLQLKALCFVGKSCEFHLVEYHLIAIMISFLALKSAKVRLSPCYIYIYVKRGEGARE